MSGDTQAQTTEKDSGQCGQQEAGTADLRDRQGGKYNFAGVPPAAQRPKITPEEMYDFGRAFAEKIFTAEGVAEKLLSTNMVLRLEYYDPENWGEEEPRITVDLSGDSLELHTGACEIEPIVIMRMHADVAHRFWMKKLNMMAAITRGQITAKGPIHRIMKLLPLIFHSFDLYKQTLSEKGYSELLGYPPD